MPLDPTAWENAALRCGRQRIHTRLNEKGYLCISMSVDAIGLTRQRQQRSSKDREEYSDPVLGLSGRIRDKNYINPPPKLPRAKREIACETHCHLVECQLSQSKRKEGQGQSARTSIDASVAELARTWLRSLLTMP